MLSREVENLPSGLKPKYVSDSYIIVEKKDDLAINISRF